MYSLESVIAEKFDAMISLGASNSRMKDFYDIAQLAQSRDFHGLILSAAVSQTLRRRRTTCPEHPAVFAQDFALDTVRISRWNAFLKNIDAAPMNFAQTMLLLQTFLEPAYRLHLQKELMTGHWDHRTCSWL